MRFYLGVHKPGWLACAGVPLFVSRRTLCRRKRLPRAIAPWALDSGGFSELSMYGRWTITPHRYAEEVRRWAAEIGRLEWAAQQDWMCEPKIREKTGLTVERHQYLTCMNFALLRDIAPDLPWAPVLQGWTLSDYERHIRLFESFGYQLDTMPVVGVGSVCRRQGTRQAEAIIRMVSEAGIKAHGFGVKTTGLARYGHVLASADSMAWSMTARRGKIRMEGHPHKTCANCLPFALAWRTKVLQGIATAGGSQLTLL